MGQCCSTRRYRLLRIFRHDKDNQGKAGTSHKRGEPDGSEEAAAIKKTKKSEITKHDVEAGVTYRDDDYDDDEEDDESDVDVYPAKQNEEVYPSGEEDNKRNSYKESTLPEHLRQGILRGDVNTLIPKLAKMVKIVVVALQEDMSEEKFILEERIFPDLKRFCREYNYDVHIVHIDIEDEQFSYMDWKEEIETAHKESSGIGFIVLVGQNFGEKFLPEKIDVKDYELLTEIIPNNHDAIRSLYELDANQIPCYVLRNTCFEQPNERISEASQFVLEMIEEKQFKLKCEQRYIFNALLQAASLGAELSNQGSRALWVEKKVSQQNESFEEQSNDDKAELQLVRQKYRHQNGSVVTYDEFAKHDILKRNHFHQTVLDTIKAMLDKNNELSPCSNTNDIDCKEVAQHLLKCQENIKNIDEGSHRTIHIQTRINKYIKRNTTTPLILHGSPGCGKSTMVSMTAKLLSDSPEQDTILVTRFLGSTRFSSHLRLLLRSLCFQLSRVFGYEDKIPESFQAIVKMFNSQLHNATRGKQIVIILDGLDELPKSNLKWLPHELPDNVKIILTALTNGGYYNGLKATFEEASDHFVDVSEMEKSEAKSLLSSGFHNIGTEPTKELEIRLLKAVEKYPNPLYVHLLLHYIRLKRTLTDFPGSNVDSHVPTSLKHVIEQYFNTVEKKYGKPTIQRIMGYLSAARFGLSERELDEILTRDHISGKAPGFNVRPFQLARILHDLSPILTKVYFDGMLILTWRHLIIRYLLFDRYLSSHEHSLKLAHQSLAQHYAGKHTKGASEDPLIVNRRLHDLPHYLCKLGDIEELKNQALCNFVFIQAQLTATSIDYVLECFTGKHCPMDQDLKMIVDALRMSSDALQIDPHQLSAQLIGRLTDLASSDHITRLLNDARKFSQGLVPNTGCLNPPGTKLLHTSTELYGPTDLTTDSTLGLSTSRNTVALWDVRSGKIIRTMSISRTVKRLLFCRNNRLFILDTGENLDVYETSTFKNVWNFESPSPATSFAIAGDTKDILVAVFGHVIRMWNLRTGLVINEIETEVYIDRIAGWKEYIAYASTNDKFVKVYEIYTDLLVHHIDMYEKASPDKVAEVFLAPLGDGLVLATSHKSHDLRVFRLSNGEWLRNIGDDIVNPRLSSDGHFVLSTNSRNDISVWSLETGVKLTNVFRHPPTSIITDIIANDLTVLVTLSDNEILRVWDLEKEETIQQGLLQENKDNCIRNIMFVKSRGEQRQAVSRSKVSGDIVVWNVSNCTQVRILKGTQADDILVVDETRAVLRSMGKLALIDLEEGRLIKKLRVSFPNMNSRNRLERRASSLYKRRNLSLRLLQRSGVNVKPRCGQFSDVAIVGQEYVLMLSSKRDVVNLISLDHGGLVAQLKSGHKECIETVIVSKNGKTLICSYKNSAAAVWDLETKRLIGWLRVENSFPKLCQATITQDGRYLVDEVKINDCTHLVVWDVNISEVQCKIPIKGAKVHAVTASSISGIIICSFKKEYRNTVMSYFLRSGAPLFPLPCGIRHQINGIQMSADGRRAMTFASGDRTIRLWDTSRGIQIGSFTADHAVSDCALSEDGNNIVLAISQASSITSLTFMGHKQDKEVSIDLKNPYYNPKNYGAVFEFLHILDWDDDTDNMDNTLAEKQ